MIGMSSCPDHFRSRRPSLLADGENPFLNLCFLRESTFDKTFLAPKIDVIGFHTIRQSIKHLHVHESRLTP
jgi:hypothetical protein